MTKKYIKSAKYRLVKLKIKNLRYYMNKRLHKNFITLRKGSAYNQPKRLLKNVNQKQTALTTLLLTMNDKSRVFEEQILKNTVDLIPLQKKYRQNKYVTIMLYLSHYNSKAISSYKTDKYSKNFFYGMFIRQVLMLELENRNSEIWSLLSGFNIPYYMKKQGNKESINHILMKQTIKTLIPLQNGSLSAIGSVYSYEYREVLNSFLKFLWERFSIQSQYYKQNPTELKKLRKWWSYCMEKYSTHLDRLLITNKNKSLFFNLKSVFGTAPNTTNNGAENEKYQYAHIYPSLFYTIFGVEKNEMPTIIAPGELNYSVDDYIFSFEFFFKQFGSDPEKVILDLSEQNGLLKRWLEKMIELRNMLSYHHKKGYKDVSKLSPLIEDRIVYMYTYYGKALVKNPKNWLNDHEDYNYVNKYNFQKRVYLKTKLLHITLDQFIVYTKFQENLSAVFKTSSQEFIKFVFNNLITNCLFQDLDLSEFKQYLNEWKSLVNKKSLKDKDVLNWKITRKMVNKLNKNFKIQQLIKDCIQEFSKYFKTILEIELFVSYNFAYNTLYSIFPANKISLIDFRKFVTLKNKKLYFVRSQISKTFKTKTNLAKQFSFLEDEPILSNISKQFYGKIKNKTSVNNLSLDKLQRNIAENPNKQMLDKWCENCFNKSLMDLKQSLSNPNETLHLCISNIAKVDFPETKKALSDEEMSILLFIVQLIVKELCKNLLKDIKHLESPENMKQLLNKIIFADEKLKQFFVLQNQKNNKYVCFSEIVKVLQQKGKLTLNLPNNEKTWSDLDKIIFPVKSFFLNNQTFDYMVFLSFYSFARSVFKFKEEDFGNQILKGIQQIFNNLNETRSSNSIKIKNNLTQTLSSNRIEDHQPQEEKKKIIKSKQKRVSPQKKL